MSIKIWTRAILGATIEVALPELFSWQKRSMKAAFVKRLKTMPITSGMLVKPQLWRRAIHAPGLIVEIPTRRQTRKGIIVVQSHWRHNGDHKHIDVSIIDDNGKELFRGATAKGLEELFPAAGVRRLLVRQPTHTAEYALRFGANGIDEIPKGQYGAGYVRQVFRADIEIEKTENFHINFNLYDQKPGNYVLVEAGKGWILTQRKADDLPVIPKHRYKTTTDIHQELSRKGMIYEEKVDGHSSRLKFGTKKNSMWSWRVSKKNGKAIRYDDKLPKFRDDIYPELNKLQLAVELVYVENGVKKGLYFVPNGAQRPSFLAGRLNSNVWKARKDIREARGTIVPVAFDMRNKIGGMSASKLTYEEKLLLMEQAAKKVPWLKIPRRWTDGEKAWNTVVIKEGGEGLVMKDPSQCTPEFDSLDVPAWIKLKHRDFLDCRIIGMQPLWTNKVANYKGRNLQYKWNSTRDQFLVMDDARVGVLEVEDQHGRQFEVGSGLSDYHRYWFSDNQDAVLDSDSYIRVRHDPKAELRQRPHAPVFDSVHPGKSSGIITELGLYEYANTTKPNEQMYAMKSAAGWRR